MRMAYRKLLDMAGGQPFSALSDCSDIGTNDHLVGVCIDKICQNDRTRYQRIEADSLRSHPYRVEELMQAGQGFFSSGAILVHLAGATEGSAKALRSVAGTTPSQNSLVVTARDLKPNGALIKLFRESAHAMLVSAHPEKTDRVTRLVQTSDLRLEPSVQEWLIQALSPFDTAVAVLEIQKLEIILQDASVPATPVTVEQLQEIVEGEHSLVVSELIDSAFAGDVLLLQHQLKRDVDLSGEEVVRGCLYHIQILLAAAFGGRQSGHVFRMSPARKQHLAAHQRIWTPPQLKQLLRLCLAAQRRLRSKFRDEELTCQFLLFTIARMATRTRAR